MKRELETNMTVRVVSGSDPQAVEWVRDLTINPRTKKLLIADFWKGKKEITGKISYVGKESVRAKLRKEKKVMVKLMNASAQSITIIVPKTFLVPK